MQIGSRLSALSTPVLVLDRPALDHNVASLARWCAERGVDHAPHGKTTMAPAIWRRQEAAGAWGITVATVAQLRVALDSGVRRIHMAGALVDPAGAALAVAAHDRDPGLVLHSWVDSLDTVAVLSSLLARLGPVRPLTVLVELGAPGGRTGARRRDGAREVAEAVIAAPHLLLGGVCGYEGALAADRSPVSVERVRAFLADLADLHRDLDRAGAYRGPVVVSAGGSVFLPEVAEVLRPAADASGARVLVRPGAYVVHDEGHYAGVCPLPGLRAAARVWARVVSRPEPGLALLDAGRRDLPYDLGLPRPQVVADHLGGAERRLCGARLTALADQHAFLELPPTEPLRVGQVVRLGLSHPCSAMDRWREIPLLDGDDPDALVVDVVRTFF